VRGARWPRLKRPPDRVGDRIIADRDCQEFRVGSGDRTSPGEGLHEALTEEDSELRLGHRPFPWWHFPRLLGSVQDQEQQFQRGFVIGEMPSCPNRAPELRIQGLYGVGGVEDPANIVREGIERDDLAPGPPPALADGGVFPAACVLLKGGERGLAGGRVNGLVDPLQRRSDGLPVLVGDEVEALPQQMDDTGLDGRR
jgi:hypothetical protein